MTIRGRLSRLVVRVFGDVPDQGAAYWKSRALRERDERAELIALLNSERRSQDVEVQTMKNALRAIRVLAVEIYTLPGCNPRAREIHARVDAVLGDAPDAASARS
jgi:hypothetical protein